MASHQHRRHHDHHLCRRLHGHYHENNPLSAAASVNFVTSSSRCCCGDCDSSPCYTQSHHQPPPPQADHLLHLVVSYLQQQQETQCSNRTYFSETSNRGYDSFNRHHHRFLHHQQKNVQVQREYDQYQFVLSCLLRRIDDLESSLHRFSASSQNREGSYCSLRGSAARVIQSHFRTYLVRRSRSLRQLKDLATIKSSFLSLKSSVSGKTHVPFEAVSREAMDLLLQLDSIRGSDDPMVQDGKKSLSRDLVMFLNYLDGCVVKRHETLRKFAKNVNFVGGGSKCRSSASRYQNVGMDKAKKTENVRKRIEKILFSSNGDKANNLDLDESHYVADDVEEIPMILVDNSKGGSLKSRHGVLAKGNALKSGATKTLRFNQNCNEYRVYGDTYEPNSSEDDDLNDDGEEIPVISFDNEKGILRKIRKEVPAKDSGRKTRVVKTVRFDENGNMYKVYGNTPEATSSGEDEDDDSTNGSNGENGERKGNGRNKVEEIKFVPKEIEGVEEKAQSENEEESSSQGSDEITTHRRNISHPGRNEYKRNFQHRTGSLMVSPPQPLKMEP